MAPSDDEAAKAIAAAKEHRDAEAAKGNLALAAAASRSGAGHVPVELALDTDVHRQWHTFFPAACLDHLLDHLDALLDHLEADAPAAPTPEWWLLEATVVSWLYGPVSLSILDAVMTPGDDLLTVTLWNNINDLFTDHKKVKSLYDGLADLDSPVDDAKIVIHCLNGLPEKYEFVADLISLMPEITFAQCRSMLTLQDMKHKNRCARNSDTTLFTNAGNPGKVPGKGKKKKKVATDAAKEAAPASTPTPTVTLPAATTTWSSPQHPWNGSIHMWPYGQGGLLIRPPSAYALAPTYVPRYAPSPHAFYAHGPYGVPPVPYDYG
ncbi:hypothetical protein QYE76_056676 [Lolium multiflorum]|uniref:Uncharacterized protein n=1 Tax=Lolium multiflorum TaxID=4521 RepID=A0AAD8T216_LOLMU|nr:hypothetical protein QYE76_056676 [Lolium multiflorum]